MEIRDLREILDAYHDDEKVEVVIRPPDGVTIFDGNPVAHLETKELPIVTRAESGALRLTFHGQ